MRSGSHRSRSSSALLVAGSPDTSRILKDYLEGAGVPARIAGSLRDASRLLPSALAVVLFPDELAPAEVVAWVTAVRAEHPMLLLVVVTMAPQALRPALDPHGRARLPLVLSKPVFGWSILDAIRSASSPPSVP